MAQILYSWEVVEKLKELKESDKLTDKEKDVITKAINLIENEY